MRCLCVRALRMRVHKHECTYVRVYMQNLTLLQPVVYSLLFLCMLFLVCTNPTCVLLMPEKIVELVNSPGLSPRYHDGTSCSDTVVLRRRATPYNEGSARM
jgi:hypothetical protein